MFARSNNALQDKREIAAFFANVAIETAYLVYVDEGGASPTLQDYHGRGSLQITGQVIYQAAGAALGLNLNGQPQLASTDPVVWQTGLWYWTLHVNPSVGPNLPSGHHRGKFRHHDPHHQGRLRVLGRARGPISKKLRAARHRSR